MKIKTSNNSYLIIYACLKTLTSLFHLMQLQGVPQSGQKPSEPSEFVIIPNPRFIPQSGHKPIVLAYALALSKFSFGTQA